LNVEDSWTKELHKGEMKLEERRPNAKVGVNRPRSAPPEGRHSTQLAQSYSSFNNAQRRPSASSTSTNVGSGYSESVFGPASGLKLEALASSDEGVGIPALEEMSNSNIVSGVANNLSYNPPSTGAVDSPPTPGMRRSDVVSTASIVATAVTVGANAGAHSLSGVVKALTDKVQEQEHQLKRMRLNVQAVEEQLQRTHAEAESDANAAKDHSEDLSAKMEVLKCRLEATESELRTVRSQRAVEVDRLQLQVKDEKQRAAEELVSLQQTQTQLEREKVELKV
jgi:hypothetical protein